MSAKLKAIVTSFSVCLHPTDKLELKGGMPKFHPRR